MRRWRWALLGVVVVAGIAVAIEATSSSGSTTRPLIVTANVTRQTLQDKVTLSGTLSRVEQRQVYASQAAQISAVPISDGDTVQAGEPILSINGRDAVAEKGILPFFRSLDVGDSGADVLELNQILAADGYSPGTVGSQYTDQTRFALAQWQAAHNYPGVTPQKPQTVTVSLAQGTGYKLGAESTAAVVIGPSVPAPAGPARATTASLRAPAPPAGVAAVYHPGAASAVLASVEASPSSTTSSTAAPAAATTSIPRPSPASSATPVLTVYALDLQSNKGQPATFIVYADAAPTSAVTFSVSTGGSAGPNDVLPPTGPFVIQAGATSTQISVPTRLNGLVESNTTVTLSLDAGSGYTVGSPASATTTIISNDVPKLTMFGGGAVSPGGAATIVISADQTPVQPTQVDVQVAGDAVPSKDYTPVASTYTLQPGQTQLTIVVDSLVNDVLQPDRHVIVSLLPSGGYALGAVTSATVTIVGPTGLASLPVVTLTTGSHQLTKGQPFAVTIGLNEPLSSSLTVALTYAGTAVAGRDYTVPTGQIIVPPGQTQFPVQIPTIADNLVEPNTILFVSVTPSFTYFVGSPNAVATSIVSQNVPELTITSSANTVAAGGATTFVITADQPPAKDTSIVFQALGTAVPGQDYQPLTGTTILRAGQTSVTVVLRTIDRNVVFLPTDMVAGTWPIRVGQVLVKEGDLVQPGTPLFSLTDTGFTVTLTASPSDRTQLKVGDQVTVTLSGGNTQTTGVISKLDDNVSTDATTKAQIYQGKVTLTGDLGAADGAAVSIDVIVQQKTNVLTVPIAAVKQNGAGQDVVRVIDLLHGGRVTEVPVKTGLSVDSYIEVDSGLKGNEVVIVETSTTKG